MCVTHSAPVYNNTLKRSTQHILSLKLKDGVQQDHVQFVSLIAHVTGVISCAADCAAPSLLVLLLRDSVLY